jgi:hypothetical protein
VTTRWGKPFQDHRNWPEYNESLVVRGEFYLDLGFLGTWDRELQAMNQGKRGGQYRIPDSFVRWLVIWKQLIDYRGLEGVTRKLAELHLIPAAPDYTTIWYRIHALTPTLRMPEYRDLELASDGTGLKTSNAGEYRIFRYGDPDAKQKKHLVVVITADVRRKKVMGIEAHIEGKGYSEPRTAATHVQAACERGYRVRKFYGDGAFDTGDMFAALHAMRVDPVIKIRKNAQPSAHHSVRTNKYRRREVRAYRRLGYAEWAAQKHYGLRWPGTEGIFSAMKRKYGENVVSRSPEGLVAEGYQRVWAYDELREYGQDGAKLNGEVSPGKG